MLHLKTLCQLCLVQGSKYTCPKCHLNYCSLTCYKSEKHLDCSESFYRDHVVQHCSKIKAEPADKQRMLQILQKDYQEKQEMDRFSHLDLDQASVEEMMACLTMEEKQAFKQLIESKQIDPLIDTWTPWWETGEFPNYTVPSMALPSKLHPNAVIGSLDYLFAYVAACRISNGEWDQEQLDLLVQFSHLLNLPLKNTFVYQSVGDCLDRLMERALKVVDEPAFLLFLHDVHALLMDPSCRQAALGDLLQVLQRAGQVDKSWLIHRKKCILLANVMEKDPSFIDWAKACIVDQGAEVLEE